MWGSIISKFLVFLALVPGVYLNLMPSASLTERALVHGVLFSVVNTLVYWYVLPMFEGFENPDSKIIPPCPGTDGMYVHTESGNCRLKTDVHDGGYT
jgi:hypothetical protein